MYTPYTNVLLVAWHYRVGFFSCNSEAIRSMSLLMENPGDFVDGLVCVCHRDPFSFGEGQSHCGQDCNNHCDRLDRGGGVYL